MPAHAGMRTQLSSGKIIHRLCPFSPVFRVPRSKPLGRLSDWPGSTSLEPRQTQQVSGLSSTEWGRLQPKPHLVWWSGCANHGLGCLGNNCDNGIGTIYGGLAERQGSVVSTVRVVSCMPHTPRLVTYCSLLDEETERFRSLRMSAACPPA